MHWFNRWSFTRDRVCAVWPVAPAYSIFAASVKPVFGVVAFTVSLDNCTGASDLFSSVQPVLRKSFWGRSGQLHRRWSVILSDHPVYYRRLNRRFVNLYVGSTGARSSLLPALWRRLNRWRLSSHVGLTGVHIPCCFLRCYFVFASALVLACS